MVGHNSQIGARPNTAFPGAQPVSLEKENLDLLRKHDYLMSWKVPNSMRVPTLVVAI